MQASQKTIHFQQKNNNEKQSKERFSANNTLRVSTTTYSE